MANRMEEGGTCTSCGGPTIDMNPVWGMCSQCIEDRNYEAKQKVIHKDARKGNPKRIKVFIPSLVKSK